MPVTGDGNMPMTRMDILRNMALPAVLLFVAACAGSEGSRDESDGPVASRSGHEVRLMADHATVKTVQLHPLGSETDIPILQEGQGRPLRLAFDVLEAEGRPLSVYFYHADRSWRRDLVPAEFLARFQQDNIMEYRPSSATLLRYTHYEYQFPNDAIDFSISGNYVVRVTEQGMEDDVLFERPFYVSEQSMPVDVRLDEVLLIGSQWRATQPFVTFRPEGEDVNAFDYTVCFTQNRNLRTPRCSENPSIANSPGVAFQLDQDEAFIPDAAPFYLNLGRVQPGGRIERTDQATTPWRAWVEPDYAKFPGTLPAPFLNGQSVILGAVPGVGDPSREAEYVATTFRFVPLGEASVRGGVSIVGSFSGWQSDSLMTWNASDRWYERTELIKQGEHEYSYRFSDPAHIRAFSEGQPRLRNQYTSFIYLNDVRRQTDRLVAVVDVVR